MSSSSQDRAYQGASSAGQLARAPSVNVLGANDRISVAIVGVGISGSNHLYGIYKRSKETNAVVAAASDVFEIRRFNARRAAGLKESDVVLDYRRILDREDIDAVVVASHDPLHAQICLDSLDAGKHVYCDQPLARYLGEAFQVFDKVNNSGRAFQLGGQSCSSGAWRKSAELIRAGGIGTLVSGHADYCRNGGPNCDGCGLIMKESTQATIDWEKWLGPAKKRPFSAALFHQWRLHYDFSAGLLATLAPHRLHTLMLATGEPEFPQRVNCLSGHRLKGSFYQIQAGRKEVPAHMELMAEFPGGYSLSLTCSWLNSRGYSSVLYGHKATLQLGPSGDRVDLIPEKEFKEEVQPETFLGLPIEDIREHEKNWFDCIRSGAQPNGNIELAIRVQTVLSLAEMADRLKITCLFDEKTRKVTDGTGNEITPFSYDSESHI